MRKRGWGNGGLFFGLFGNFVLWVWRVHYHISTLTFPNTPEFSFPAPRPPFFFLFSTFTCLYTEHPGPLTSHSTPNPPTSPLTPHHTHALTPATQGDLEAELGLPISPFMDRNQAGQAKMSMNFIDFLVKPLYASVAEILPKLQMCVDRLVSNHAKWRAIHEENQALTAEDGDEAGDEGGDEAGDA